MLNRILILDLSYLLRRCIHVPALAELVDDKGRRTGGVFGVMNSLQTCMDRCAPCDKIIGVWDGGRSERRLTLFPPNLENRTGYKANRGVLPGMTPDEVAEKEQQARDVTMGQELATPILLNAGVHVIRWPGREADDVIAALARELAGTHANQVMVVSDDWDYAQCCSERVCVFRPGANSNVGEWIDLRNFVSRLGVPIDWVLAKKAIEGDTSDNIPGVKGVGPKYVSVAVQEFVRSVQPNFDPAWYEAHQYRESCPADLTPFYEFCQGDRRKKLQAIGQNRQIVERNIELMDFRREEFPAGHIQQAVSSLMVDRTFHETEVIRQLGELKVSTLLENFYDWSQPFRRIR